MKLSEVAGHKTMLGTMLLKLVAAGSPVRVSAKGKTFLSGNETFGYEAKRSNHTGWVIQHRRTSGDKETSPVETVRRLLDDDVLHLSSYEEYAVKGTGSISSSLFEFEKPIDDNYTIKKVDGVWTIVDKQASESVDFENQEFMLKLAMRKMRAAGLDTKLVQPNKEAPYLMTEYASFSVKTFCQADDDGEPAKRWLQAWYYKGIRHGKILEFGTVDEVIADFGLQARQVPESQDVPDASKDELFMHRMMLKLVQKEGHKTFPFDGESVDVDAPPFKAVIMYFDGKESPWIISWFNRETNRSVERNRLKTPRQVLRLLAQYKGKA